MTLYISNAKFISTTRGDFDSFGFYDYDSPQNLDPGQTGSPSGVSRVMELYRNDLLIMEQALATVSFQVTGTGSVNLRAATWTTDNNEFIVNDLDGGQQEPLIIRRVLGTNELDIALNWPFNNEIAQNSAFDDLVASAPAISIPISPACTYTLTSNIISFDAGGGTGTATNVIAPGGCTWQAVSNASWITVTSGSTGSGNGAVVIRVDPNGSYWGRSGTLTIAGQTFEVDQSGDKISPVPIITLPTSSPTYSTTSSTISLGGTASDNVGVTQVTWSNDRGGSGTAGGTTSWTINGISLQSGVNNITVTASDAAGNQGTDTIAVTYTPPDTTKPTITITSPTSNPTYSTTSSAINLGGTASDNVGVTQVTWSNDRGGSGTAGGTTSWTINGIALQSGVNNITVTAWDAANNQGTATIAVTYTPPDTTKPTITITSPTSNPTYSTTSRTINLGGTASDNVGVTQVTWSNDRGGSGTAGGTTSWTINGIALQSGVNNITVTAWDAANNQGTATIAVTYTPPG